jgi:hypothetical protein
MSFMAEAPSAYNCSDINPHLRRVALVANPSIPVNTSSAPTHNKRRSIWDNPTITDVIKNELAMVAMSRDRRRLFLCLQMVLPFRTVKPSSMPR